MIQREPEEIENSEAEAGIGEEDVEELKQKAESYLANWQRAQADFINYKQRSEQEREETSKFANAMLMLNLLPVLDDLERAFASMPPRLIKLSASDGRTWIDGIRLIERKLQASLEAQGLSLIKALGEPFDPKLHEAAMHGKGKEGEVIKELQKGYKLQDRIIRPTIVVVGNGEEEEENKEE